MQLCQLPTASSHNLGCLICWRRCVWPQVEEFRERQWMVANGHLSMRDSIDDFRVVVGDNTL